MQNEKIYSQRVERHVLGGLIKHQNIFPEIEKFVSEKDFYFEVHHTIFRVLKNNLLDLKVLVEEKKKGASL